MLAAARAANTDATGITWVEADIAAWRPDDGQPGQADLIYTNAALQWLPDHAALLPRLMASLAPGGVLAVQMPRNYDTPSHTAMRAAAAPWWDTIKDAIRTDPVAAPAAYYAMLADHAADVDIWESEYLHVLTGSDPVVTWTRATGLRPYLGALDEAARATFVERYRAAVAVAYPPRRDGTTLFPFRRIFIVARRATEVASASVNDAV